jgi:hypothetical protein
MANQERPEGWKQLGFVVLVSLPAVFCIVASAQFANDSDYARSALWFIFQVAQYVAVVGILVNIGICIVAYADLRTSRVAWALMVITVLGSIYLLWMGIHIYKSPWF